MSVGGNRAGLGRVGSLLGEHPKACLAAFCLLLFLPGLGGRDLWNPDEPRYAEVTREMLAEGNLLVPHLNGRIYSHKPPMMFWAMALASLLVGGLTETAVRLPSAMAALGTVLATYGIGRRMFDRRAGVLAALALATSVKVLWQARTGQIDMLLTFFVALSMYLWTRALLEGRGELYLVGFAVAGVGTVTKGPVALLPILLAFVIFLFLDGNRREIARMRIGRGLLIWLGVVLLWLVPAALAAGRAYFDDIVLTQNLTRLVSGTEYVGTRGHLHPWYYLATVVSMEFLPWTALLPAAALALARSGGASERRAAKLLACWAGVTLVFFSIPEAKRSVYVLQMYPALALLVGGGLSSWTRLETPGSRWVSVPLAVLSGLLGLAAIAIALVGPTRPETEILPATLPYLVAAAVAAMAVVAGLAAWWARRRRPLAAAVCLAAGFGSSFLGIAWGLLPTIDVQQSVRPLAQRYLELAGPNEPYGFFPAQEPALQFYTGRLGTLIETEEQLDAFLARPGRVWLFAEPDGLRRLGRPIEAIEVARSADRKSGYVLYVKPPTPPAAGAHEQGGGQSGRSTGRPG